MKLLVYPRSLPPHSAFISLALVCLALLALPGCRDEVETELTDGQWNADAPPPVQESVPAPAPLAAEAAPANVEEVVAGMLAAYKSATSYSDAAVVRLTGSANGQPQEQTAPCAVAMERPNKIRMQIDNGALVCDGEQIYGFVRDIPDQILALPAPEQLSIESLYPDYLLAASMMQSPAQSYSWAPVQLILLLADDPMKTLAMSAQSISLLEPAAIDQTPCHRVQIDTANGPAIFWIDQANSVLRRLELPANAMRKEATARGFENLALTVEFRDAQLNLPIDPNAFVFQSSGEAAMVEELTMPLLKILGQPFPDMELSDMEGKPVSIASLKGKVVILVLWSTQNAPCRPVLQAASKAYADLSSPDDVVVMAVNLDGVNVRNAAVQSVLKDWKVELPAFRDLKENVTRHFKLPGVPITIGLGKKGLIQAFQPGSLGQMDVFFTRMIERLQEGEDLFQVAFKQFQANRAEFEEVRKRGADEGIYCVVRSILRAPVSERSEPEKLKMTKLWSCEALEYPGNITVLPSPDGPPRVLVLDGGRKIVDLKTDGTVAATHALELSEDDRDYVTVLRTAVGGEGKPRFLGVARQRPHAFLFDGDFKTLLKYPGVENPGIGDGCLADIDGNGKLEVVIGYVGAAGVQAADLQGERLWSNRSMVNAIRVATLTPDAEGHCSILAANVDPAQGTLVELDWQGALVRRIAVPDRSVGWMAAEDLDGDGTSEICVLAEVVAQDGQPSPTQVVAMGIDSDGNSLWQFPLALGVPVHPIEPVAAGNVFTEGPRQWLIPSADGVINIVGADGRMVERFAYGTELAGLATAQWDGHAVLLVSTSKGVDAWQIQ